MAADARELPTAKTAELLRTVGYPSSFDPAKLWPSVYNKLVSPSLGEMLGRSAAAIQQARRDTKDPAGLAKFLNLAIESLDDCAEMRRADQAAWLIRDFNEKVSRPVFREQQDLGQYECERR